jgi:hypothetical protein
MADKEFTYSDVSEHNTKKDLYMVIHDKVYDASSFVDEHPYVAALYTAQCPRAFAHPSWRRAPLCLCHMNDPRTNADVFTEVEKRFCSMSGVRTQQKHLRMLATRTKPARSSTVYSSES